MDRMVRDLKFGGDLVAAAELAAWFVRRLPADAQRPDCLLPVPLHPRRLLERGYNQAAEVGRYLSSALGIPLDLQACRRVRHTPPQSTLDRVARRRNVRRAFAVSGPLRYRRVAIVDDVMTTGWTAGELARVLKRAGASHVEVWAIARAGQPS